MNTHKKKRKIIFYHIHERLHWQPGTALCILKIDGSLFYQRFLLCANFFFLLFSVFYSFFSSLSCVCGCFIYTDFKLSSQISTERKKKKKKKRREKTTKRNWHKLWMKKKCRFQFSRYYKFFLLPHISRTDRYSVCIILVCQTKRNLLCAISLSYYNASIFAVIFSWLEFDRQIIGARPV